MAYSAASVAAAAPLTEQQLQQQREEAARQQAAAQEEARKAQAMAQQAQLTAQQQTWTSMKQSVHVPVVLVRPFCLVTCATSSGACVKGPANLVTFSCLADLLCCYMNNVLAN
eukprot:scaffold11473_cov21-Tisochrysis_lutea.AAC.2